MDLLCSPIILTSCCRSSNFSAIKTALYAYRMLLIHTPLTLMCISLSFRASQKKVSNKDIVLPLSQFVYGWISHCIVLPVRFGSSTGFRCKGCLSDLWQSSRRAVFTFGAAHDRTPPHNLWHRHTSFLWSQFWPSTWLSHLSYPNPDQSCDEHRTIVLDH